MGVGDDFYVRDVLFYGEKYKIGGRMNSENEVLIKWLCLLGMVVIISECTVAIFAPESLNRRNSIVKECDCKKIEKDKE